MPARRLRPKCRHIFTLFAVLFVVPATVAAQGTVTLRGSVSETVALSVAPSFRESNVGVVSSGGNTVRITWSPGNTNDPVIHVPLLMRSNSSFKISASVELIAAELGQLSVTDVHATGTLVSPPVVNALEIKRKVTTDTAQPWLIVTGPRVSLGGTLASPNNALQITLLIRLKPQVTRGLVHLTFVATAGSVTP